MKNKIKALIFGSLVAIFSAPAVAFGAGFDPTAGGATNLPGSSIMGIATNIMNWLLTAIGIAGVIGFAISGIFYLTAAGDDDRIKKAKSAMVNSIIGVLVAIAGVVALRAAAGILGGQTF